MGEPEKNLICPECGSPMTFRQGGRYKPFYGCTRYPECKGTHGAHPDGRPLGKPATLEVKRLRMATHATFDPLWQPGHQQVFGSRSNAYAWMQRKLGLTEAEAHIANFDAAMCRKLVEAIWEDFGETPVTLNL